ncbi:hypothetical protein XENORESO_002565 [Xenotaenia resolanae]|uniref:Uncharacterized protein n=1 Tax=Xenotaenia resolanae TaxID=208358 RepID=A0ABV0W0K9_9TELE
MFVEQQKKGCRALQEEEDRQAAEMKVRWDQEAGAAPLITIVSPPSFLSVCKLMFCLERLQDMRRLLFGGSWLHLGGEKPRPRLHYTISHLLHHDHHHHHPSAATSRPTELFVSAPSNIYLPVTLV